MTLDPAQDPDRFDPAKAEPTGPLDPAADPDRFRPGMTLPDLLGPRPEEDRLDPWTWLYGLVLVFGFLGLVTLVVYL